MRDIQREVSISGVHCFGPILHRGGFVGVLSEIRGGEGLQVASKVNCNRSIMNRILT